MRIVWSPLARERISEIADQIGADRPLVAERWLAEVLTSVRRLERFPRSGRSVPEVARRDVREIIQGQYRIVYRIDADRLVVLTIRHARQQVTGEDLGM